MKLRKTVLAFVIAFAMITGNVPVWAAGEKAPLPTPDSGLASFDVTFVSRMPVREYLAGGLPDETLNVAAGAKVDKSLLTNADLRELAPGSVHAYGGKDYEFVGWYAHSTVGDFYSPVGAAHGFDKLPAIEPGDMYGVLVPWDFDNGTVTLEKTLADYRHTNRVLYLYAKWKEKGAHPDTVRFHLTDATGTPPPEKGVAVGGDWSTTASELLPGTVPTRPGTVFVGWSTSEYRKPDGNLVLEIKAGERIDARDEGADLYSVWVTPEDPKSAVTVDFSDEYQTMVGVGASWAFHKWNNFKYVYDLFKAQGYSDNDNLGLKAVKRYIDQEEGVGMDLVRLIIGDGGVINTTDPDGFAGGATGPFAVPGIKNTVDGNLTWGDHIYDGANDTIWPTPPTYDGDVSGIIWNKPGFDPLTYKQYGRTGFGDELFDEDQIWFAKKAVEINPDVKIYASLWSPPYWMKSNQNVRNDYWWNPMGNPKDERPMLLEKYYDEFAVYLAEYAYGMMKHYGVPIYALCPTNETEIAHGYSGYVFQGDDYGRFLKDYLYPVWDSYKDKFKEAYTDKGYPVPQISAPEGTRMDRSTSPVDMGTTDRPGYGAMMSDEEIYNGVSAYPDAKASIFSTHLYEYNQYFWEARTAAPKGNTDPAKEDPFHPSYLRNYSDIWMAEMGPSDTNYGVATARFLGNLFGSDPGFTGVMWWWPAQTLSNGGNVRTSQPYTGQMSLGKTYYVSGQYSRFINDGYIRVGVDDIYPFEGANVTAYKDGVDFVIVAANETASAKTLDFNLSNVSGTPNRVVPYRTSPNENIKRVADIAVSGGKFTAELPAYSVTSFVYHTDPAAYLPGLGHHSLADVLNPADNDGSAGAITTVADGVNMADGAYVAFKNFNFADGTGGAGWMATPHVARINARGVGSVAGGVITARLGGPGGKAVASIKVAPGPAVATASAMMDTGDLAAHGFNDLYFTVRGDVTVGDFYFDGVRMAPANQMIASDAANPASVWTGVDATLTSSTELPYESTFFGFIPTANIKADSRSAGGGAAQALTGAFTDGRSYTFKCQLISTDKSLTGAARPDATVVLAAYNGGVLVDSQPVAARSDLWALDWAQVDGSFIYAEPAAAYDKLQLEIRMSGTDPFYIANASLVAEAMASVTVRAETLPDNAVGGKVIVAGTGFGFNEYLSVAGSYKGVPTFFPELNVDAMEQVVADSDGAFTVTLLTKADLFGGSPYYVRVGRLDADPIDETITILTKTVILKTPTKSYASLGKVTFIPVIINGSNYVIKASGVTLTDANGNAATGEYRLQDGIDENGAPSKGIYYKGVRFGNGSIGIQANPDTPADKVTKTIAVTVS